ncbi:MAG: polyhydroxyalkanoate depolymerase [Hyphomicrobium sp.]
MLYQWYELSHAALKPARAVAASCRFILESPFNPLKHTPVGSHTRAACEVFERTTRRYVKPVFGLNTTCIGNVDVRVDEEVVWERPFCRLIRFHRDIPEAKRQNDPRVLLVAPMSGHFATLLRGTVQAFLPNHEVYITDWHDARSVPHSAGRFGLEDYIDYVRDMLALFGGDVHVFAVCQPSVPVLAAVSLMEEDGDPNVPRSMILAGGPIDTRKSPTAVNKVAVERGTGWFRRHAITQVPWPHAGAGRRVYPGFLQLTGFISMNLDRHASAHKDLFLQLVRGDGDGAFKHREFYDEYLAVMDLTADFYIETIDKVFVRHALPKGALTYRGRTVDPGKIRRTALMTIEGEKDDITGLGQCRAAHDLCTGLPETSRMHYEAAGVGHYGIFNGSRFRTDIAPRIEQFMRAFDRRAASIPEERATAIGSPAASTSHEPSSIAFTFGA